MDRVEDKHTTQRRGRHATRGRLAIASLVAGLAIVPFVAGTDAMPVASAATSCTGATYTVVANDSWSFIAAQHKVSLSALLAANGATTSTMIHPGQVVCLPAPTTATTSTTTAPASSTTAPRASSGAVTIKQFPVQGRCWFTDTWGAPRSGGRQHEGVDIIAKTGQYLYAVDDGTLTKQYVASAGSLAGNGWRLTRSDGTYFFYAHLSEFAPGLRVGSRVLAGQVIGFVGMTGNAGTPHLHFEVHPGGGAAVSPIAVVKAVDGCAITEPPPQPGGVAPPQPGSPAPATTVPATTVPVTTVPVTTVPATTVPAPTVPVTTVPAASGPAATWKFIAPAKAFDTGGQKLARGVTRTIPVTALAGVPADASGLLVRMAARNVSSGGYLSLHSCDAGASGGTSTLSLLPGRLNATMTMVKVVGGAICVTSSTATDLRIDVVAHVVAGGVGVQPIVVKRAFDTRSSTPIAAGGTKAASPKALGAPTGTKAVTVTVTLLAPAAAGSIGIGACGGTPWIVPFTDAPRQVFSAVVRTTEAGVCVSATASVHVVLDVTGVWTGTKALVPAAPQRLFDSRRSGGLAAGVSKTIKLSLPSGATRAQLTVTVLGGANAGALRVWNCSVAKPTASVAGTGAQSTSAVTVTMDVTGGSLCLEPNATLHAVVDLVGLG